MCVCVCVCVYIYVYVQVLNEPKHNIKGGEIAVQAAAPKNDRFERYSLTHQKF
jgi:hypothetical protein